MAFAWSLILLVAAGCSETIRPVVESEHMERITGSVFYRERIQLPPGSEIKIFLEDVSKADAPSEVIASTMLLPETGPPWSFVLEYDPAVIDSRHRYALRSRIEIDGRLMFINTSHIPAFGPEKGKPVDIMVSRVGSGGRTGSVRKPDASLTDTYWKPVELEGQPVTLGAGEKELSMVLVGKEGRVRGYSGCNQFTGGYDQQDDQLKLTQLASTMKACVEGMEQEQRFLRALGHARRFSVKGDMLTLFDEQDRMILRFEAIYLY